MMSVRMKAPRTPNSKGYADASSIKSNLGKGRALAAVRDLARLQVDLPFGRLIAALGAVPAWRSRRRRGGCSRLKLLVAPTDRLERRNPAMASRTARIIVNRRPYLVTFSRPAEDHELQWIAAMQEAGSVTTPDEVRRLLEGALAILNDRDGGDLAVVAVREATRGETPASRSRSV